jgi:hypothetical protein
MLLVERKMVHIRFRGRTAAREGQPGRVPVRRPSAGQQWVDRRDGASASCGCEDDVEAGAGPGRVLKVAAVGGGSARRLLDELLDQGVYSGSL